MSLLFATAQENTREVLEHFTGSFSGSNSNPHPDTDERSFSMTENDSTDSARPVNSSGPRRTLKKGEMVSTAELTEIFGKNTRRMPTWKAAGLQPLETGTNEEYFDTDELFDLFKKLRQEKPK